MSGQETKNDTPKISLFQAYFGAISAYRIIMIETINSLAQECGEDVLFETFDARSIPELYNLRSPAFFTHRRVTLLGNRGRQSIVMMHKRLRADPRIKLYAEMQERNGRKYISDDIVFYIEQRILTSAELQYSQAETILYKAFSPKALFNG